MTAETVSASYAGFQRGLCRLRGYCVQEEGERLTLAFEPWFAESDDPFSGPCLRLTFHRLQDRVVLERFVVCDSRQESIVSLEAAHDALQAWMDFVSD
jgi:hypothetical protein